MPGIGYLSQSSVKSRGIPEISNVSEQLVYACEFLPDHIGDIGGPKHTNTILSAMRYIGSNYMTTWIEIVASKGKYRSFVKVREWLEVSCLLTIRFR